MFGFVVGVIPIAVHRRGRTEWRLEARKVFLAELCVFAKINSSFADWMVLVRRTRSPA
ncbi:hypothetical protein X773_09305 [Mesorhizobium sp. LSJC285A00]|nr:hypothetical protein X773_09305 [Mesorhizobium sp. LSJC285A00]ESX05177.1 hypothetical protein X768_27950 [Mesorhizobium sp. LSJC265A00]